MAIQYSYPVKSIPSLTDYIIIADSENDLSTKQIYISSLTSLIESNAVPNLQQVLNVSPSSAQSSDGKSSVSFNLADGASADLYFQINEYTYMTMYDGGSDIGNTNASGSETRGWSVGGYNDGTNANAGLSVTRSSSSSIDNGVTKVILTENGLYFTSTTANYYINPSPLNGRGYFFRGDFFASGAEVPGQAEFDFSNIKGLRTTSVNAINVVYTWPNHGYADISTPATDDRVGGEVLTNTSQPAPFVLTTTSGGSSTYDNANNVIYVEGFTPIGNYTLNLPTSSSFTGHPWKQLEFILDGQFSANHTLTLDGNGNTIDGASTLLLNRAYEGATLLFTGTEWIIRQLKK
jgi:hypothetical protein